MTHDQVISVLDAATGQQDRSVSIENPEGKNYGGMAIKKADGSQGYGPEVAGLLLRNNGTIIWDPLDPVNGADMFNNIYEFIAAEIHAPIGSSRDRMEVAQSREHEARSGVISLGRYLDESHGFSLYRPNSCADGYKNKVGWVTLHGNLVVRDSGETAAEVQVSKDKKAISGQAAACFKRVGRELGPNGARRLLEAAMVQVVSDLSLPEPKHPLLTED